MKKIRIKIFLLVFLASFITPLTIKAQYEDYDEQKAQLFYSILNSIMFPDDVSKDNYNIGTYGCTKKFINNLKKYRRNKFFTGNNFNIMPYTPSSNPLSYDVIIIGQSKNNELDAIYNKLLKSAQNGHAIALFTNFWKEKSKVCINFIYSGNKEVITFEYNTNNLEKFNITASQEITNLKGHDIKMDSLWHDAQFKLLKAERTVKEKEKELQNILTELNVQKAKIQKQKSQITNQQKMIEQKQLEIKRQQSNLQNLLFQMQITQKKLQEQEAKFSKKEQELKEKQQAILDYQKKIDQMQMQFSMQKKIIDKKNAEVQKISKQVEAKKKELGNLNNIIKLQRFALIIFAFLLAIIVVLAIWIFRNYRKMKEQNIVLEQQKNEIEAQALELEKINTELEKLSIVASQTNNAVSILNEDGRFNWVNSGFTKLYGYTLQLLENELDNNILHSPLYNGIEETFKNAVETKESLYFEHQTITRGKKALWIQTSITPILNYNNEVKLVVLVDSDITAIKQAERQIAEQNKNIKKSILYASRIQKATLPSERIMQQYFPEHFILYLPRDIVSGDFYWAAKVNDKRFFAAADCTGHGVPGAFMSMLGITLLNEIVTKESYDILRPDLVLTELRKKLINALSQSEEGNTSSDGIAIALCMVDENNEKLHYAGAENEMILIRNKNLYDYMADDIPIGISAKEQKDFTNNVIEYQKGDMIYLFSDGYVDQFGGPGARRKKFLIKRLRELLLNIHTEEVSIQKEILLQKHLEWKGKNKQVDDILIMGVKL